VPALEEALGILVSSYNAMGMTTLRDDAQRVLQTNYPQSLYLNGNTVKKPSSWWRLW
jgi:outer membrane protein assembly factor BamD